MESRNLCRSGGREKTAEPGVEWVDGQLQPSRSAHEAMSAAIDGALELVLSLTVAHSEPATRRILLQALTGTVDDELRRLDAEAGAPTGNKTGSEAVAATAERKAVLAALRNRIAAMPEAGPSAARKV